MLKFFINKEIEISEEEIKIILSELQNDALFENSRLDTYNDIICDSKDLETIIIKHGMRFFGRSYLYKVSKSPKMLDESYDKTFYYISVSGVFDTFTKGSIYKKYYNED